MSRSHSATGRAVIRSALVAGLLGCGMVVSTGTAATGRPHNTPPRLTIYTLAVLRRDLAHTPAAWLGRVVWVRARPVLAFAWTCRHDDVCVIRQSSLADPTVDAADARLPLLAPAETPLVALVRHVPLLARWAPRPPALARGRIALYHIQLTAPAACADPSCVAAQLVPAP
jgi:hypothetical protein